MFEKIDIYSSVPVYTQVENMMLFAVASGSMKADDQFLSIRELAEKLNLNPNTVAKAYRDLDIMGIVYARKGMGVFVKKGVEAKCREMCRHSISRRIHEVVSEAIAAGMTAQEIKAVCTESFGIDAELYGDVPASLLALAKPKK